MNDAIDDNSYLLVIIIMVLAIVIFGGYNKHNNFQIEYNPQNYQYLNSLTFFEKKLQKYNHGNFDFMQITNQIDLSECLIPNILDIFFVNIKPKTFFNIVKHVMNYDTKLMVIFNHNIVIKNNIVNSNTNVNVDIDVSNLMLLLDSKKECNNHICENYEYLYSVNKKISILNIYPIYNDSVQNINITIFIIKKSFWYV
jgi:hypothetical protein